MEIEKLAIVILITLSFVLGLYVYPMLPASVASHWDVAGNVDGYMPSLWATFLIPVLSVVIFLIFLAIPIVDPMRANIESFKTDYYRFCFVIILFLFLIYIQTLLWDLGTKVSFNLTIPILYGALLFYLGIFIEKTKQNWFIGIRTPWTMSSPEVWKKTHIFGAKLLKVVGVLAILSVLLPAYTFLIIIALMIVAVLASVIYSYLAYADFSKKKLKGNNPK